MLEALTMRKRMRLKFPLFHTPSITILMLCPITFNPHNIFDIRTVHNIFRRASYQIFRLLFALKGIRRVMVIGKPVSVLAIRESVVSHRVLSIRCRRLGWIIGETPR